jgi:hypothetical protein
MKTYIGTLNGEGKRAGNKGLIYIEQENGSYKCKQTGFTLTAQQINHDLNLGYLELHEDGKVFQHNNRGES